MDTEKYFEELVSLDASDWNNIPGPLKRSIMTIKNCIIHQIRTLLSYNDNIEEISKRTDSRIWDFDQEIKNIRREMVRNEDTAKSNSRDTADHLKKVYNSLQSNINSEISYLKKNTEGKIAFMEQSFESMQKYTKGLLTSAEIEEKISKEIKTTSNVLRIEMREIRDDIKNLIIDPEVFKMTENIRKLDETIKNIEM